MTSTTANQMLLLDWIEQHPGSTAAQAAKAMHISPTSSNDWALALVSMGHLRWEGKRPRRYWVVGGWVIGGGSVTTTPTVKAQVIEYLEIENKKQRAEIERLRDEVRSLRATLATPGRLVPLRRT